LFNLSLHRFDLSTGYPQAFTIDQVIHRIFTAYPQADCYPQLVHRISTGLSTISSYPQDIHNLSLHRFDLSTGCE
jgi:hypothetical protein